MAPDLSLLSRIYCCLRELLAGSPKGLGGRLLAVAASSESTTLVRASSIAGAATLLVCEDPVEARLLARQGVCDFLVANLDEALRILKNQVRLQRPVCVCVHASAARIADECKRRGVQADLIAAADSGLFSPAARVIACDAEDRAERFAWQWVRWTVTSRQSNEAVAALALSALGAEELEVRAMWLRRASPYLGRPRGNENLLPMSPQEAERFRLCLPGELAEEVRLWFGDEPTR